MVKTVSQWILVQHGSLTAINIFQSWLSLSRPKKNWIQSWDTLQNWKGSKDIFNKYQGLQQIPATSIFVGKSDFSMNPGTTWYADEWHFFL